MSKDPIRFDATGTNLYVYAVGDPVNVIDPNGRNPAILIGICAAGGCEGLAAAAAGVLVGAALLGDAIGDVIDDALDDSTDDPLICDDDAPPESGERCPYFGQDAVGSCVYWCKDGLRALPKGAANDNICPDYYYP